MAYFKALKRELIRYLSIEPLKKIEEAYKVAEIAHKGQKRQTGESYIMHPAAVAYILATMRMDPQTIMAALLHDVLEDTKITKQALTEQFGIEVAELVDGVSKLAKIQFSNTAEAQAANFRKMILAMVRDIRVILVKLADRLHNMRTLGALETHKRRRIALETLEIYAPIAHRLGMNNLRLELEDLGFATLHPRRHRVLKTAVQKARGNRKEILTSLESALKDALEKRNLPPCAVFGREKHLYSIYKKMRSKHLSFNEIMDIYGFRIVTDNIDSCYRVLGAAHALYKPVPERFKDYIAIPKANGYQSLHTILFGPYGVPIEIQIRTVEMDSVAEHGIAAHWVYKADIVDSLNPAQVRAREWLKGLLEMQQSTGNSLEFIENVKIDLFPDEVYVFTPKGRIIELPMGATPVDFAYQIHSAIGDSCVAAKINRRLAPLSSRLANGQNVEIITAPGARPNPAWLNFVVTGKARGNIRHFLKSQRRSESIAFGEQLLNNLLSVQSHWSSLSAETIEKILSNFQMKSPEDLFEAIGMGNILPLAVIRYLQKLIKTEYAIQTAKDLNVMTIRGTEGVAVHFGDCCHPIPGDHILGIVQPGHGLEVHRENCLHSYQDKFTQEQVLTLQWHGQVTGDYPVEITIEALNRRGLLAQLTARITEAEADINNVQLSETEGGAYCQICLTLSVRHRVHLAHVLKKLRQLPLVLHVHRRKS